MKNILSSILISSFTLFTLNSKAIESPQPQKEIIQHHIQLSGNVITGNQKVEVLFTTDKNGKVNFVLAKTPDSGLKKNIEKQFFALTIPGLNSNVVNSITLNIKLI